MNRRNAALHPRPHFVQYGLPSHHPRSLPLVQPCPPSLIPGHIPILPAWNSKIPSLHRQDNRLFHPMIPYDFTQQFCPPRNGPVMESVFNLQDLSKMQMSSARRQHAPLPALACAQNPSSSVPVIGRGGTTSPPVPIASDTTAMLEYYTDSAASSLRMKKPASLSESQTMPDHPSLSNRIMKETVDISTKEHAEPSLKRLCQIGQQIKGAFERRELFSTVMEDEEIREKGILGSSIQEADDSDEPSLIIDIPDIPVSDLSDISREESTFLRHKDVDLSTNVSTNVSTNNEGKLGTNERCEERKFYTDCASKGPSSDVDTAPPETDNSGKGKFRCKKCPLVFKTVNQLVHHKVSCKSADKSQQTCAECNMTFHSSKATLDHWKEYHSVDRKHECMKCGRRFTVDRALEIHSWTHK